MNVNAFREIAQSALRFWQGLNTSQKLTAALALLLLAALLAVAVMNGRGSVYVPLYSAERLLRSDAAEVAAYLDREGISYQTKGETILLVREDQARKVRMALAAEGLPKRHNGKGFELFDSNTWMKGDKELQVMELRALKGQLESDIAEYENIRSASIILDVAPPRPLGGALYKTKASIILSLKPGARLDNSQLRAITFHVAGAVRGLQPNMVAISDTTGKLYQAMDPDGDVDLTRSSEIALEERIKAKVDGMLATVVGLDHFYSTVEVVMSRQRISEEREVYGNRETGVQSGAPLLMSLKGGSSEVVGGPKEAPDQESFKPSSPVDHVKLSSMAGTVQSISIGVLIDRSILAELTTGLGTHESEARSQIEHLKKDIEDQLKGILEGYHASTLPVVDFVTFAKPDEASKPQVVSASVFPWRGVALGFGAVALLAILVCLWAFRPNGHPAEAFMPEVQRDTLTTTPNDVQKRQCLEGLLSNFETPPPVTPGADAEVLRIMKEVDPKDLALYLKNEKPQTVAWMLSTIEAARAAAIVDALPSQQVPEILASLAHKDASLARQIQTLWCLKEGRHDPPC